MVRFFLRVSFFLLVVISQTVGASPSIPKEIYSKISRCFSSNYVFAPDQKHVAFLGCNGDIKVLNISNGAYDFTLPVGKGIISKMEYSRDGEYFLTIQSSSKYSNGQYYNYKWVNIYETASYKIIRSLSLPFYSKAEAKFSPDSKKIVYGYASTSSSVKGKTHRYFEFDLSSKKDHFIFEIEPDIATPWDDNIKFEFHPNGNSLIIAKLPSNLVMVDLSSFEKTQMFKVDSINGFTVDPSGQTFATISESDRNFIYLYDLKTGSLISSLKWENYKGDPVSAISYNSKGTKLGLSSMNQALIFDLSTGLVETNFKSEASFPLFRLTFGFSEDLFVLFEQIGKHDAGSPKDAKMTVFQTN